MDKSQQIIEKIRKKIVTEDDIQRVVSVLKSGYLSKPDGGPVVEQFQNTIGKAHNQKYAIAVNSGTSALHCAMSALGLDQDDEVIIPALSNIADCSTIIQEGGKPIFADISSEDFNIDPEDVERKITEKTRAIVVVHMYGQPGQMDELVAIAKKHNLILIEDCAQAAGAKYKGKYVGSFGDISCFSLYQTKHIICGEGGLVLTSNDSFAKIVSSIVSNGIIKDRLDDYDYDRIGYNYQLSEIQAALGIGQFERLDENNRIRRANVEIYKDKLSSLDIKFQRVNPDTENSYFYLTTVLPESFMGKRNEFLELIKEQGAPIKKLYPLTIPEFTLFKDTYPQDCEIGNKISKLMFNFYVNPGLDENDIDFMSQCTINAYNKLS